MAGLFALTTTFEPDELTFLIKKRQEEQRSFWVVMRSLLITGLAIPILALMIFKSLRHGHPVDVFVKETIPDAYFLLTMFILMAIIGIAGYVSYYRTVYKVAKDCKEKIKIIESASITRKIYMKENNSYYFYLNSPNKLSIEVTEKDYKFYGIGDEVNIEYSKYAKEYFGYF